MRLSLLKIPSLLLATAAVSAARDPAGLMRRLEDAPEPLKVGGVFHGKLIREGRVIDEWSDHNLIVNSGLDHVLGVAFGGVPVVPTWYMAPFGNNYAPVGTDTAASIATNAGEITSYSSQTRVAYQATEGGQQVTNAAAPASFTFTSKQNVYGAFLISSPGQGATTGTLFAAAQFASPKSVDVNDQLLLTYVLAAASA